MEAPCIQFVLAQATDQVVIPFASEQLIGIASGTITRVAPKSVVPAEAIQIVASDTAVHEIATIRTDQRVDSAIPVEYSDIIPRALIEESGVQRYEAGRDRGRR